MSILILVSVIGFVGLFLVPTIATALMRMVENDGSGPRPGPRSHPDDSGPLDRAA